MIRIVAETEAEKAALLTLHDSPYPLLPFGLEYQICEMRPPNPYPVPIAGVSRQTVVHFHGPAGVSVLRGGSGGEGSTNTTEPGQ